MCEDGKCLEKGHCQQRKFHTHFKHFQRASGEAATLYMRSQGMLFLATVRSELARAERADWLPAAQSANGNRERVRKIKTCSRTSLKRDAATS